MQIGMVGLGRMGANMARRMARKSVHVAAYDLSPVARSALEQESGVTPHAELAALVAALPAPRVVWVMLPSGEITEQALQTLAKLLAKGDVLVDGGNANYKDSRRRAGWLTERGLGFVDAGVSGGVWGLDNGYALMLGGAKDAVAKVEPFAKLLAPGAGSRLDSLRAGRRRTLRQDDPQRHRIRNDAGLRRRSVDDESQIGIRPRPCRDN